MSTCREVVFWARREYSNCTRINFPVGGRRAGWGTEGIGAGASRQCPAGPWHFPGQWGASASRKVPDPRAERGIPGAIQLLIPAHLSSSLMLLSAGTSCAPCQESLSHPDFPVLFPRVPLLPGCQRCWPCHGSPGATPQRGHLPTQHPRHCSWCRGWGTKHPSLFPWVQLQKWELIPFQPCMLIGNSWQHLLGYQTLSEWSGPRQITAVPLPGPAPCSPTPGSWCIGTPASPSP